jgi:hypothetical protein
MEGSRRGRRPPLELERKFAGSRLEEQILIRAYELVVPVIRRSIVQDSLSGTGATPRKHSSQRVKKGA